MKLFNILALVAAAIILISNQEILNYAEKKSRREGKPFDRKKYFILTMIAVGILILKGLFV